MLGVGVDGEHVVPTGGENQRRGAVLGVHRIDGDHHLLQVEQAEKLAEIWDLVALGRGGDLTERRTGVWSNAATRRRAALLGVRAPRTVLPSKAINRGPPTTWMRLQQNAPGTYSAARPPISMSSSVLVSLTHSPIAANDRASASTAATPTTSRPGSAYRTPRGSRGSGTCPNRTTMAGTEVQGCMGWGGAMT